MLRVARTVLRFGYGPAPDIWALLSSLLGAGPAVFMNWARRRELVPSRYVSSARCSVWSPLSLSRRHSWSCSDRMVPVYRVIRSLGLKCVLATRPFMGTSTPLFMADMLGESVTSSHGNHEFPRLRWSVQSWPCEPLILQFDPVIMCLTVGCVGLTAVGCVGVGTGGGYQCVIFLERLHLAISLPLR